MERSIRRVHVVIERTGFGRCCVSSASCCPTTRARFGGRPQLQPSNCQRLPAKAWRIFAITYAEGSRTGGLQPWVGMGSAKAALESLVRYFAVALGVPEEVIAAKLPSLRGSTILVRRRKNVLPDGTEKMVNHYYPSPKR